MLLNIIPKISNQCCPKKDQDETRPSFKLFSASVDLVLVLKLHLQVWFGSALLQDLASFIITYCYLSFFIILTNNEGQLYNIIMLVGHNLQAYAQNPCIRLVNSIISMLWVQRMTCLKKRRAAPSPAPRWLTSQFFLFSVYFFDDNALTSLLLYVFIILLSQVHIILCA